MIQPAPALRRALGRWDLTAIGINQVIGAAIFLMPAQVAAETSAERAELRELGAHRVLQQADRSWRDLAAQIVCRVIGDPFRNASTRELVELDCRCSLHYRAVFLASRNRDEHEHDVVRRMREVLIEGPTCVFPQRAHIAYHDHASLGHHWRSAEE